MYKIKLNIILLLFSFTAFSENNITTGFRIDSIIVYGNVKTKIAVINSYLKLTKGMTVDSTVLENAKQRLLKSELFRSVNLIPHNQETGITLYVILSENQYIVLNDIGVNLYDQIHGKNVPWWWRARIGFSNTNFMGRKEILGLYFSFWKARSIKLSWFKPMLSNPWYFALSSAIYHTPDFHLPMNKFSILQKSTVGYRTTKNSRAYISLIPTYNHNKWQGGNGVLNVSPVNGDSISTSNIEYQQIRDTTWTDTVQTTHDEIVSRTWTGYNSYEIDNIEAPYKELFIATGWAIDHRNQSFYPKNGYYFGIRIKSNILYPNDKDSTYAQLDIESRLYHRGILPNHTVSYRLRPTFRIGTSKRYDALYAGGESTLRGYVFGHFGRNFLANNRLLFSTEYKIPTFSTPPITYPIMSQFNKGLKNFYYRIDFVLFADGGYLWNNITEPTKASNHEYGTGAGCGIRIVAPTIKHSACIDFAWSTDSKWINYKKDYYYKQKEEFESGLRSKKPLHYMLPEIYLYLDMFF